MKLSNILPTSLIGRGYDGDFIMALASYIDAKTQNNYEKAILKANLPIVLDSGTFETGQPDGVDNLLRKARRLKPKYVFTPDILFDKEKTRFGYQVFKDIMKKNESNFKIGIVIQANNLEDYLKEFQKYNSDPDISVIGLSYLAASYAIKYPTEKDIPKTKTTIKSHPFNVFVDPDYTEDRIKILKEIEKLKLKEIKPLHLLGLGKSYTDIEFAKNYSYCRYNDTSTCYMAAKKGFILSDKLEVPGGKIREKINIADTPSKLVEELLKNNINKVNKNICRSIQTTL